MSNQATLQDSQRSRQRAEEQRKRERSEKLSSRFMMAAMSSGSPLAGQQAVDSIADRLDDAPGEPEVVHAEVIDPGVDEQFVEVIGGDDLVYGEVIEDDRQAEPVGGYDSPLVEGELVHDEFPSMQAEAIDEAQREIDIALGRTAEPVPESEQQLSNKKRFPELFAGQAGYDGSGGRGGPEGPPALTKRFPELYSGSSEGPRPIELGQQLGG